MGGFGKYVLKLKFFECTVTKSRLPFPGVNPSSSPWGGYLWALEGAATLAKGRCFIVLGQGGKFAPTRSALPVIPLHSGLRQRVGLCKPFLKSLHENTADSPSLTSEN